MDGDASGNNHLIFVIIAKHILKDERINRDPSHDNMKYLSYWLTDRSAVIIFVVDLFGSWFADWLVGWL